MPKKAKVTTVDDILTQDDVTSILENLNKNRAHIRQIIAVVVDDQGHLLLMGNTCQERLVYLLEKTKQRTLLEDMMDGDGSPGSDDSRES